MQELSVPSGRYKPFLPNDTTVPPRQNLGMNKLMSNEERGRAALARFRELMDDLSFDEDTAMDFVYEIAGRPADLGKKAIKQWYSRGGIPPYAVFNIAAALGIDVSWLGGSDYISKEKAIQKGGPYHRELERVAKIRAEAWAKRPRKIG